MGGSMPVYAILFGEVLGALSKDVETARSDSVFYSLMFLLCGVVVGLAMFFQGTIFRCQGHLKYRMQRKEWQP